MKTKILKTLILLIIGILGFFYYSFFTSKNVISNEIIKTVENIPILENTISSEIIKNVENIPILENIISEFPVFLKIPKINVDANVINIGITPSGKLDTPKDIKKVGLYKLGPFPGEEGSAVIDGHFGWINKNPAVFNNLFKIQKGDEIFFHNKEGKIITFIVSKIEIYSVDDTTTDIFISNDGKAHLNIITCEGVWDKITQSYTNRLVVFSDKLIE